MKRLSKLSLSLGVACLLLATPGFVNAQGASTVMKKAGGKMAPSSPVDINNASQADLVKVPGIGDPTAKKIIAGRPYNSVADLSKAGLSAKQIQTLSPMLKVGPAGAAKMAPAATAMAKEAPVPTKTAPMATKPNTMAAGGQTCSSGQVWGNTETKVYHYSGDKYYGNTKHGKCMAEADAQKAGYHASKQK